MLRYSKLSDSQVLERLLAVGEKEDVSYTDDGLEAIIFTAQGDMRQALNNLQSTSQGFGHVNSDNVFKVSSSTLNRYCTIAITFISIQCFMKYVSKTL